jgi:hypothetical protein
MYYQSSARPNDPSEPESDRLKTLLDNLNNLRGKLKNFTVIDELGQPIGEISDLILDAGHQLNLVIAQPDAQARQSSVLLNGRRIKKVSVQTQSVFVDITKADVRFLPEYLLPDTAPATESGVLAETPSHPATNGGMNLAESTAEAESPDFSLDVMESPTIAADTSTPDELPPDLDFLSDDAVSLDTSLTDLDFLNLEETASATPSDEFGDLALPNEARSLDEFALLDSAEIAPADPVELPELDLSGVETATDFPDLSLSSDATDEWDEFDRIMATDPTEAIGTLDLGPNLDEMADGNPVPESFALVDPESGLDDVFPAERSENEERESANRLAAADLMSESTLEDDFADLSFDEPNALSAVELSAVEPSATEERPELSFAPSDRLPDLDLAADLSDDLPGLSVEASSDLPSLDFTTDQTDDLSGLSFEEPAPDLSLDFSNEGEDLAGLNFAELASTASPDLNFEDDLSGLSFDEPAPDASLDLTLEAAATSESNLESEWADFDREMDLPSIELSALDTSTEPAVETTTDLDFTNLELPEETAMDLYLEAANSQPDDLFGESVESDALSAEASLDFTAESLDFNDALSFVESEENISDLSVSDFSVSDLSVSDLGSDTNEITFTEDESTTDSDLEAISSLADLDFSAEATPSADDLDFAQSEPLGLIAEPNLDLGLDQPIEAGSLDFALDQPDALNLDTPETDLDFSLEQSSAAIADTSFDLNLDEPATDTALDLEFDQPVANPELDLGEDEPAAASSFDLVLGEVDSETNLDFGWEQPIAEPALDLDFDQPEPNTALDLSFDQAASEPLLELGDSSPEATFDLDFAQAEPVADLDLSFDQPVTESNLEMGRDASELTESFDLSFDQSETADLDLSIEPPEAVGDFELGLDSSETLDLTAATAVDFNLDESSLEAPVAEVEAFANVDSPDLPSEFPAPPELNLDDLALSSTPIDLPDAIPTFTVETPIVSEVTVEPSEFGLASIPAETFELSGSETAAIDTNLLDSEALSESSVSLPIDSVDAIVPLLEERLKVEYDRRKVGEVIVRKRIETRMVQVPVRYEKLVIEQVGEETKTLAEVDLSQGTLDNIELAGVAGKPIVSGEFKSPKTASYVLDAIAKTLQHRCKSVRIEIELDDPKLQKAYQDWLDQCSQM